MTDVNPPEVDEILDIARAGLKTKKVDIRVPAFDYEKDTVTATDEMIVNGRRLVGSNIAIGKAHKKSPSTLYLMHPEIEDQALGAIFRLKGAGLLKGGEDLLIAWMAQQIADLPAPMSHTDVRGEVHTRISNIIAVMTTTHGDRFNEVYRIHREERAKTREEAEEKKRRELIEQITTELMFMSAPDSGDPNFRHRRISSAAAVKRIAPFASKNEARFDIHACIRFVDGRAIATDGHRIMMVLTDEMEDRAVNLEGLTIEHENQTSFDQTTKAILQNVQDAANQNNTSEIIDGPFLYAVISRMAKLHEVSNKTAIDHFVDFRVIGGRLLLSMVIDPLVRHSGGLDHPITVDLGPTQRPHTCDGPLDAGSVLGISPYYLKEALEGVVGPVVISYAWDAERDMQLIEVERDGEVCIIASCGRRSTVQRARWYTAGMEG